MYISTYRCKKVHAYAYIHSILSWKLLNINRSTVSLNTFTVPNGDNMEDVILTEEVCGLGFSGMHL